MEGVPEECPGVHSEHAGKTSTCEGCPNQSACASGEKPQPEVLAISSRFKQIVLVLSGKGGVGKSTVTSQLAFALAEHEELNIGLLDIDICGPSQPRMTGLEREEVHSSSSGWSPVYNEEYPNLGVMSIGFLLPNRDDPVIWRGPRKNGLIKQFLTDVDWGVIDYLLVDCPPGTSDEHLSIVQFLEGLNPSAIVVTTPQEISLLDVRKEIGFCRKTNISILGVVENMSGFVCPHCSCQSVIFPTTTGGADKLCLDLQINLLSKIPLDPLVAAQAESGCSLQKTGSPSAAAFRELAQRVQTMLPITADLII
jgi:Mrp family chromosome partitioning ATPase